MIACADRLPQIERATMGFEDRCRSTINRCDSIEMLCRNFLCPGNVNFSQRTLDEYSGKNQVKLNEIVTGLGDPYVNAYPVPPTKKIRLTHKAPPRLHAHGDQDRSQHRRGRKQLLGLLDPVLSSCPAARTPASASRPATPTTATCSSTRTARSSSCRSPTTAGCPSTSAAWRPWPS
jgi:hypothetical protein